MRALLLIFYCLTIGHTSQAQDDSLDIKIGQMIMVGMQGNSVTNNSSIMHDIQKGIIGGVLLYEYNLNPNQTSKNLLALNKKLKSVAKIPLFISIDQEGGQVNRLKTKYGFPPIPSAQSVGKLDSDSNTLKVAQTIASTLDNLSINLNYAPVLDIFQANNPVLGKRQRCYSSNVEEIAHHASLTIKAHHDEHILTVVKHFPGHGSSNSDTHLGIADVSKTWHKKELVPYKMLIDKNMVDCIMTAHIVNRKLDSRGLPATLSKQIITGILREQMGYEGVVVSDDMQMHAISSYYGFEESIKKSINAGVDILMFSNNIKGADNYAPSNVHAVIKKLVLNGEIPMSRIEESFHRIMLMKQRLKK
jgi:beta-N-acetylhexosaminidase